MMHFGFWTELAAGLIRIGALARRLFRGRRGSVAIMMGVLLGVLIGMAALGTEITLVLYKQRQMQSAADTAALSAATALSKGYPDFTVEGRAIAAAGGFVDGTKGITVTINRPPASGPRAGNPSAVEVIIAQPQPLNLVRLFTVTPFNVSARAVALKGAGGDFCVLATDAGSATAVPSATVQRSSGPMWHGGECIRNVVVVGDRGSALGSIPIRFGEAEGQQWRGDQPPGRPESKPAGHADPYASVARADLSGCNHTNKSIYAQQRVQHTLTPGVYCGGLRLATKPS